MVDSNIGIIVLKRILKALGKRKIYMIGFAISNIDVPLDIQEHNGSGFVFQKMCVSTYYVCRNTLNKFGNDKLFFQNDDCAIVTEGVLLNKTRLFDEMTPQTFFMFLSSNIQTALKQFKGPYSGAIFDKTQNEWMVWTNQTGESSVFYYCSDSALIIASTPDYILEVARSKGLPITINEDAIKALLTYGFMYDDSTLVKEVKRLLAGQFLTTKKGTIETHQYYEIPWNKYDLSDWTDEKIVDEINQRFVAAIKLEYDKDLEYGYSHLSDLSGGFDCRMATWVARKNGYNNIVNIHYSQSMSNEEKITIQISNALGTELLFYPLDTHRFLFNAEELIEMNYGLQIYSGITGGERLLGNINLENFGLEHTGMIGDVVLGSHFSKEVNKNRVELEGLYSTLNKDLLTLDHLEPYLGNPEKQFIMIRGLLGALSSAFIRRQYIEIVSPFMDVDFLEFCFSIPIEKRANHKLYKKWIVSHYPEAAKIRWATDDTNITDNWLLKIIKRAYCHCPQKLARVIGIKQGYNVGMNPFEYWVKIDKTIIPYWEFLIRLPDSICSDFLITRIYKQFSEGTAIEKMQAVTAALAIKYWMGLPYDDRNCKYEQKNKTGH